MIRRATSPAASKSFRHYWSTLFRTELRRVLRAAPPRGGHDPMRTVQPWRIGPRNPLIRRWPAERRERFATALYLMLDLDAYIRNLRPNRYEEFAAKFGAPRFIGDCPGGCVLELNAADVLFCLGDGPPRGRWQDRTPVVPDPALEPEMADIVTEIRGELHGRNDDV